MKRALLISSIAVVAVAGTAVWAAGGGKGGHFGAGFGGPRASFSDFDANSDGKLTQEEMAAHAKARFDAADADGNGAVSSDEMVSHMQAQMAARLAEGAARMIERHDANDDGALSLDEMAPVDAGNRMFSRLDKDGDGAISAEEFSARRDRKKGHGKDGQRGTMPDNN